jgi:hypothetical protein
MADATVNDQFSRNAAFLALGRCKTAVMNLEAVETAIKDIAPNTHADMPDGAKLEDMVCLLNIAADDFSDAIADFDRGVAA